MNGSCICFGSSLATMCATFGNISLVLIFVVLHVEVTIINPIIMNRTVIVIRKRIIFIIMANSIRSIMIIIIIIFPSIIDADTITIFVILTYIKSGVMLRVWM